LLRLFERGFWIVYITLSLEYTNTVATTITRS
jgi:hypothetical protein